jgi:hypothetical protein
LPIFTEIYLSKFIYAATLLHVICFPNSKLLLRSKTQK